jgi:transposase
MNKREFQAMLDRSGSSLMKAATDLGLANSTVSRWIAEVPGYAQWYAHARALMTKEQLAEIDARFRTKA